MKKKGNKNNKRISTLDYFSAVCFYIVAIINFINNDNSTGVVFLCLGSAFLCLGSVCSNKDKDKNKK